MSKTIIRKVEYKCARCGELDSIKLYESEQAPVVVNCWKCHAGLQLDPGNMIQKKLGMFQTGVVETFTPALG